MRHQFSRAPRWQVARFSMLTLMAASVAACRPTAPVNEPTPVLPNSVVEVPEIRIEPLTNERLVVIMIDALPATRLHAYGYPSDTTPFLTSLANESLVMDNAYANSSFLGQSLSAFTSGRYPTAGGTVGLLEAVPRDETATLPQQFLRTKYYTGIVTNQPRVRGKGFTKGFEEVQIGPAENRWTSQEVVDRALAFVDDAAEDPYYLQVQFAELQLAVSQHAGATASGNADQAIDTFDMTLTDLDAQIRRLAEGIRASEHGNDTAILITSPYGAEFGEHGYIGTGWTLHEESVHVPLILHAPAHISHIRWPQRLTLASLAPTIETLFGLDPAEAPRETAAWVTPENDYFNVVDSPEPMAAELLIPERCMLRAIWHGDWKYIATIATHPPAERKEIELNYVNIAVAIGKGEFQPPDVWGLPAHEELYNLADDPNETSNLADTNFDRLAEMRNLLREYRTLCEQQGLEIERINRQEIPEAVNMEQLESLGYL